VDGRLRHATRARGLGVDWVRHAFRTDQCWLAVPKKTGAVGRSACGLLCNSDEAAPSSAVLWWTWMQDGKKRWTIVHRSYCVAPPHARRRLRRPQYRVHSGQPMWPGICRRDDAHHLAGGPTGRGWIGGIGQMEQPQRRAKSTHCRASPGRGLVFWQCTTAGRYSVLGTERHAPGHVPAQAGEEKKT